MSEEEKHGCNRDGDEPKRQVVKGKKEKQKKNGRGCDRNEKKKSARNALRAEGKAFVPVSAGLIRDLKQMLVGPAFRIVFGMNLDNTGNDCGEQFVRCVRYPRRAIGCPTLIPLPRGHKHAQHGRWDHVKFP